MFNTATVQQWFNDYGLKIIIAAIILIVAHFAAKAVKWSIAKAIDRIPFFARRDGAGPGGAKPMVDVGERIGEVGYWLVWLLGLMAALNELGGPWASSIIAPLNGMVEVGGPERFRFDEFIRQGLRARNDSREVVADPDARYFGAKLSELTLVASGEARIGELRFEDWLSPAMSAN